jgi:glycosyltransferase involved in cell wall biosynthesis
MCRPVVASKIGGVPELIVEGKTGWTIHNSLSDDWIRRIQLVTYDARIGREIGRQDREWVEKNFVWSIIAKQVERIIMSCAEGLSDHGDHVK